MPMKTDTMLAIFLGFMINAVVYGALVTLVLSIDALKPYWEFAVPVVIVLALVSTPFIARWLAPRIRREKPIIDLDRQ